jgi:hypothetical protein
MGLLRQLCPPLMATSSVCHQERCGREWYCLLVPVRNLSSEFDVSPTMNEEYVHVADEFSLFSATDSRTPFWLHLIATIGSVVCSVVELTILGLQVLPDFLELAIQVIVLSLQVTFLICFCVWQCRNKLKLPRWLSSCVHNGQPWVWQCQLAGPVCIIQFCLCMLQILLLRLVYFEPSVVALNFIQLFLTSYVMYYDLGCWRRQQNGDNVEFLVWH